MPKKETNSTFLFVSGLAIYICRYTCTFTRLYKLERLFMQQVDLKSALNLKDFI